MNTKINILFVLPNFDTGGSEKLVVELVTHLDKTKFNPMVCVFFSGVYEAKIKELGIPFYCVHEDGRIRPKIEIVNFLNRIVREHKIDIVNTHHTSALLQGLLSFKVFNRARLIHTEHTRLEYEPNMNSRILKIQKFCMKFVDVALGISEGVCESFRDELGVPERKIVKILNGVDVSKFRMADSGKQRAEKRKELGIGENDIVIGTFANFRKQKNHSLLLRAFALMKRKSENGELSTEGQESKDQKNENHPSSVIHHPFSLKLLLAGDGPEFEHSKQLCRDLGLDFVDFKEDGVSSVLRSPFSILFLGMRTDIPELMNMIDIYCLPSHFEGLPISLIEAFAAGKQVVATDVDGNRDVVKEMGCGILVEPDNPEGLADAILGITEEGAWSADDSRDPSSAFPFPFSFNRMMKSYEELFYEYADR